MDMMEEGFYTQRMKQRIYMKTSIVSYLAARPSRDLISAARQQITHEWWLRRRTAFEVYVSELMIAEASAGDPEAAARRGSYLSDLEVLDISVEETELARRILETAHLPRAAMADALHVAVAACNGMDFLLTWNSAHIADAELRPLIDQACRGSGYVPPILCTPDALMGVQE